MPARVFVPRITTSYRSKSASAAAAADLTVRGEGRCRAESCTVIAAAETAGPRRTLIVDDDDDMLLLVRVYLGGFSDEIELVGEATGPDEALREWRTKRPDVIVMDNRMPGRTGLEVAEEILGEDEEQGIILFTAYVDSDVVDRASEVGVCEVIGKDRYRELPEAIRNCKPAER